MDQRTNTMVDCMLINKMHKAREFYYVLKEASAVGECYYYYYYYGLPYLIGQTIIFSSCGFFFLSFFFFSSPNLSRRRLDAYHTSTHGVWP